VGITEKLRCCSFEVRFLVFLSLLLILHLDRLWRTVDRWKIFVRLYCATFGFSFLFFHRVYLGIFFFDQAQFIEIIDRKRILLTHVQLRYYIRFFKLEIILQNRKWHMSHLIGWLTSFHHNNAVFALWFFRLLKISYHFVQLSELKLPLLYFLV
jgi:hypothetical protein